MAWMAALPISTQERWEKVQPHGYIAPPFRLFTQFDVSEDTKLKGTSPCPLSPFNLRARSSAPVCSDRCHSGRRCCTLACPRCSFVSRSTLQYQPSCAWDCRYSTPLLSASRYLPRSYS